MTNAVRAPGLLLARDLGRICCIKHATQLPRHTAARIIFGMGMQLCPGKPAGRREAGGHRSIFLVLRYQSGQGVLMKSSFSDISSRRAAGSGFLSLWQAPRAVGRRSPRAGAVWRPRPMPSFRTFRKRVRQRLLGGGVAHSTPFSPRAYTRPDGWNRQDREPPALRRALWRRLLAAGAERASMPGNSGRHAPAHASHGRKRIRAPWPS